MQEIIRLEHVSYGYEDNHTALENVSLRIVPGEKIAVLGSNGAGKSTFFLCCNGILKPAEGEIYLGCEKIEWKKPQIRKLRQTVGLVFQEADHQLIAGTVEEEVSFGPMNLKLPLPDIRERVDGAIRDMDLNGYRKRAPHELSGGEKKRVTIADVLAMGPRLLLLDEPASSLDPVNERLLEQNLEQLSNQGISLAVATHDVDFAWRWADRSLVFHQGRLVADDKTEVIFSDKELLELWGLKRPVLYETGMMLGLKPLPRSLEELSERLSPGGGQKISP